VGYRAFDEKAVLLVVIMHKNKCKFLAFRRFAQNFTSGKKWAKKRSFVTIFKRKRPPSYSGVFLF